MNSSAGILESLNQEAASLVTHEPVRATSSQDEAGVAADIQETWGALPCSDRVAVLRRARRLLATQVEHLTTAISPALARTPADTLVAEVLPLLAACRFLERNAGSILKPRKHGASGRPVWLPGIASVIERVPLGTILVIGPANYPLFLPGVQALQALAAGNRVIWKPGAGGRDVALVVAEALATAGLPSGLLVVTAEHASAAETAIDRGVDKIILTGSAETGRTVLHRAAKHLTPVIAELSGADALIVLPSADLDAVADAIAFSMRLNGSATCMAPRRLLLVDFSPADRLMLLSGLRSRLSHQTASRLSSAVSARIKTLLAAARSQGASVLTGHWTEDGSAIYPTIVVHVDPGMVLPSTDLFAPILCVIDVQGEAGVLAAQRACPLALTAAIFGDLHQSRQLARKLKVGVVLINDLIVATADPRLPFGGRGQSGFGSTRGAEGLLEMTAPRVIVTQRGQGRRRYEPVGALHFGLFAGVAALLYAGTLRERWHGLQQTAAAGRALTTDNRRSKQNQTRQQRSGAETSCT